MVENHVHLWDDSTKYKAPQLGSGHSAIEALDSLGEMNRPADPWPISGSFAGTVRLCIEIHLDMYRKTFTIYCK